MAGIKRYEDLTNSWADADTGIMPKLKSNPYAPIDAASVTSIDDSGAGFDDFGHQIGAPAPMPTPQSWGDMAHGIATAPIRLGGAIVDSLSPYHQNEHPITDPNASSWQVPPLISESWDAISSFGNAYNNGMSEDDMRRNANIAAGLTMGGGGLAARPAGGVGMFAGRLAKTADHEALARAEQMATQGADRRAIWDQTGWFQGPDQKWRFEIDDSGATLTGKEKGPLRNVLDHPELANAYPDVAGIRTAPSPYDETFGQIGSFYDEGGQRSWRYPLGSPENIGYAPPVADKSHLLHEAQHAIQKREGTSVGGNELDEYGVYGRLAGEVESRNVQTRMNMSADERRATPPWETQDIPDADQIVRMYSNASKEASLPAIASWVGDRRSIMDSILEAYRPGNQVNMFGGRKAKTANLDALGGAGKGRSFDGEGL